MYQKFASESKYACRAQDPQNCILKIDQVKEFQALSSVLEAYPKGL
jgi:hypothetical protein